MSGDVISLRFPTRKMARRTICAPLSFTLTGTKGRWSLHPEGSDCSPSDLLSIADNLREIARTLTEEAHAHAGVVGKTCLAEFVLYEGGGIDHWVSPEATTDKARFDLKIALRNAIRSVRK